jgi:hypothetical protein
MNKFATIAALESAKNAIETAMCWASRKGDSDTLAALYRERGNVIHELRQVGQ